MVIIPVLLLKDIKRATARLIKWSESSNMWSEVRLMKP
jgi:hypothetical protein